MIFRGPDDGGTVYQGDTGEALDFLFLDEDGVTALDLTGHHGWVEFWYRGESIHLTRAGLVDAAAGILRYSPRGDEFPTLGYVSFQATVSAKHVDKGVDRGYFTLSHEVIRRRVVPRT